MWKENMYLCRQTGKRSICYTLRNYSQTQTNTGNEVGGGIQSRILRQPPHEWYIFIDRKFRNIFSPVIRRMLLSQSWIFLQHRHYYESIRHGGTCQRKINCIFDKRIRTRDPTSWSKIRNCRSSVLCECWWVSPYLSFAVPVSIPPSTHVRCFPNRYHSTCLSSKLRANGGRR